MDNFIKGTIIAVALYLILKALLWLFIKFVFFAAILYAIAGVIWAIVHIGVPILIAWFCFSLWDAWRKKGAPIAKATTISLIAVFGILYYVGNASWKFYDTFGDYKYALNMPEIGVGVYLEQDLSMVEVEMGDYMGNLTTLGKYRHHNYDTKLARYQIKYFDTDTVQSITIYPRKGFLGLRKKLTLSKLKKLWGEPTTMTGRANSPTWDNGYVESFVSLGKEKRIEAITVSKKFGA